MYSFKRVTINEVVYNHNISGYVKYVGYAIPVMHGLTYCSVPSTVTIDHVKHTCPNIRELSKIYRDANGKLQFNNEFSSVRGICIKTLFQARKDTGMDSGYYGHIIVYGPTKEAIRFLEMLRDQLYSTPFYIEITKDKGIDEYATRVTRQRARLQAQSSGKSYIEPDTVNKNKYYAYHVDIDELNSFIEDLRNRIVEFPVEYITMSTATDPIKPEPVTEAPKRVTWRWSV